MADNIFTPAPPMPRFEQQNPLQMASEMQKLMAGSQQMQQQQEAMRMQMLQNKAKETIGALAAQSFDPKTGELNLDKLLGDAAQHPDAAVGYPELVKQALDQKLISAQRHGVDLENRGKELEMLSGSMAGLVNDPDIQNNTPAAVGKIAGAFAQLGMSTGKPRGWAAERLLEVKGLLNDNKMSPKQFVQNSIMQTKNGREALASSLDQFRQATEPVKTMEAERGPDGQETGRYVETMIPRHEYNRRMEARFGNPMSPVSAPSGGMGRQEQQPSAAPAAMGLPTGVPSGVTETSLQSKMATDSMMQIADMSGKLEKMGYNTGLFAPEQMNLAKAVMFIDPNNESGALDYVVSEKDPQKAAKVIGTMEAFDKQAILQKTEALRQAMGSAQNLLTQSSKPSKMRLLACG
jgi:hypothetical protein